MKVQLSAIAAIALAAASCASGEDRLAPSGDIAGARQAAPAAPAETAQSLRIAYRRLTENQYRSVVADAFGSGIEINARFEPEQRLDGLLAVGNSRMSITTPGMEQYVATARSIADQVVEASDSSARLGCNPVQALACAEAVARVRGAALFRRPLSETEVQATLAVFRDAEGRTGDAKKALKFAIFSLMVSSDFLFRVEQAEPDPAIPGQMRLEAYTKASRLSFLLWDAGPDAELFAAARSGALHTPEGLSRQLDRMLASPRLASGVRAFFTDMLRFDGFDSLSKDPSTYPLFSQAVADAAREETLRMLVDQLVTRDGDYRDIFTTRETIINRTLAAVYNVPYASAAPWAAVTFAPDAERAGVLTQASTLALFAHPASSSPTIRGVNLNDIFLCQPTPPPPPNVDFSKVQATQNGTVRSRLIDHMTNPGCAACHRLSDPVGLTLEHFDGIGQLRKQENGQAIDVSGEIGGKSFTGAPGLGQYLHDNTQAPECLVRNVYLYGQGRAFSYKDEAYLENQADAFSKGGYRLRALYRAMISSPEFFKVVRPQPAAPAKLTPRSAQAAARSSSGG